MKLIEIVGIKTGYFFDFKFCREQYQREIINGKVYWSYFLTDVDGENKDSLACSPLIEFGGYKEIDLFNELEYNFSIFSNPSIKKKKYTDLFEFNGYRTTIYCIYEGILYKRINSDELRYWWSIPDTLFCGTNELEEELEESFNYHKNKI